MRAFTEYGWEKEGKAIPELDLKFDFRKSGVQVEVEFGNAWPTTRITSNLCCLIFRV